MGPTTDIDNWNGLRKASSLILRTNIPLYHERGRQIYQNIQTYKPEQTVSPMSGKQCRLVFLTLKEVITTAADNCLKKIKIKFQRKQDLTFYVNCYMKCQALFCQKKKKK